MDDEWTYADVCEAHGCPPPRQTREEQPSELHRLIYDLIHGSGGMNNYQIHELVIWHDDDRVATANWVVQCLANPKCNGAQEILDAILERRAQVGANP